MAFSQHTNSRSTYGNLAFNLDALAKELDREEVTQKLHREEPRRERKSTATAQARANTIAAVHSSVALVVTIGLLLTMVMALLLGYVQLTKVSTRVSAIKSEIAKLDEEHLDLLTQYEKTFDLATIKNVAQEAGMSKPSTGQIEYIDLSDGDVTVVYKNKAPTVVKKAAASFESGVLAVFDFFN